MPRGDGALIPLLAIALVGCYAPRSAPPLSPAMVAGWADETTRHDATARLPAGGALDVEAAIAYALRHGPAVGASRDEEQIAAAEIDAAGQLTNPEVRLGHSSDTALAGGNDEFSIALRLHPDMPWARSAKIAAARAERAAARARTGSVQRELAAEIRTRYATLAFGDATRQVFTRQLAVLAERERVLGAQLQRGATTRLEVALAAEDQLDLESSRAEIEAELARTQDELAALLGLPPGAAWHPVWDLAQLEVVQTDFDRPALSARALAGRPELAEVAHRAEAADALAYGERTGRVPWIDTVQVERTVGHGAEWAVSVHVALPIFSQNGGEIAAADARRNGIVAERRRLAAATLQELAAAITAAEVTGRHARELAERTGPLDRALTELVAQAGTAAAIDPVKLLLLEERHVRARRALLDATYQHRLALIALDALTGGK